MSKPSNADKPALPVSWGGELMATPGLTKRELFMLVALPVVADHTPQKVKPRDLAEYAGQLADAMLDELEANPR